MNESEQCELTEAPLRQVRGRTTEVPFDSRESRFHIWKVRLTVYTLEVRLCQLNSFRRARLSLILSWMLSRVVGDARVGPVVLS